MQSNLSATTESNDEKTIRSGRVVTNYPFRLCVVNRKGTACAYCPWSRYCPGCELQVGSEIHEGSCLGVTWQPDFLKLHYDPSEPNLVKELGPQKQAKEKLRFDQMLSLFLKEEQLGQDEQWLCSECQELRVATKKLDLWKLPPILIIHLKRFKQLAINHHPYFQWVKQKKHVDFPVDLLDLSPFVPASSSAQNGQENPGQFQYELYAVLNHIGSLSRGHYTAYVKESTQLDGECEAGEERSGAESKSRWFKFSDTFCEPIPASSVVSNAAYVLFYRRKSS